MAISWTNIPGYGEDGQFLEIGVLTEHGLPKPMIMVNSTHPNVTLDQDGARQLLLLLSDQLMPNLQNEVEAKFREHQKLPLCLWCGSRDAVCSTCGVCWRCTAPDECQHCEGVGRRRHASWCPTIRQVPE